MGSNIVIKHVAKVKSSPCVKLIPIAWLELLNNELILEDIIPVSGDSPIIWLEVNGKIASFIHYYDYNEGEYWIGLGYTVPGYRKKGYYQLLYNKLRKLAQEEGVGNIFSITSARNKKLLSVAAKLKRNQDFVYIDDRIKPKIKILR